MAKGVIIYDSSFGDNCFIAKIHRKKNSRQKGEVKAQRGKRSGNSGFRRLRIEKTRGKTDKKVTQWGHLTGKERNTAGLRKTVGGSGLIEGT